MPSIRVPFAIDSSGRVGTTTTPEQIAQQQIIDILTTAKFERIMRPYYGAGANQLLFEPVDDLIYSEFRNDALQELSRSLRIAKVMDIRVRPADASTVGGEGTALDIWVRYTMVPFINTSFSFRIVLPETLTEESTL